MDNNVVQVEDFLIDIESILKKIFEVDNLWMPITLNTHLGYGVGTDSLDLSSIDFVELIVRVEELYDITFEFDIEINTIQDLYDYLLDSKRIVDNKAGDGQNGVY